MDHTRETAILRKTIGQRFLYALEASNGFVAGGAVRAVFASEPILDVDIFFREKADIEKCVEALKLEGEEFGPSFSITDSAWTHVANGEDEDIPKMRFQLIEAVVGSPAEVIKGFDFSMCMGAWDPTTGVFILDSLFLKHVAQRRLCFNPNAEFPICSLWRATKFIKRGWKLPGIEAIKLALAIHNIGLGDLGELKRQLLGIDTIFLKALTDALATKHEAKYDFGEAVEFIADFLDDEE